METPFPAYKADPPYIFVCFSHTDVELVYSELVWLRSKALMFGMTKALLPVKSGLNNWGHLSL